LVRWRRCDLVVDLVDGLGAPSDRIGGRWHVDGQGIADGFAHVEGFQQRQLLFMGQDQVGETDENPLALCRRQP